jgi:tetratricopeptide (TPR) repeat protein
MPSMKTLTIPERSATLALFAALLSGCATSYVPDAERAKVEAPTPVLDETVYFEVNSSMAKVPDCIHVLPFEDPKGHDPKGHFRKSFHAQLSVTGVRLVPLQAIHHEDISKISGIHSCDFELRGSVTENSRLFLGVYSEYKAGAKAMIVHRPSNTAYWTASHTMAKRDGGLPIGIISSIASALSAARNVESDQELRVTQELAHRMVKSIPNLQYSPAAKSTAFLASSAPSAPLREVPASERLELAVKASDHESVVRISSELIASQPTEFRLFALRGRAQQALGTHEKATSDFISAIALGEAGESPYVDLGRSYAALGRFDYSAAAFDKAITINSKSVDALMLSGVAHAANGDDELAYERLRGALVVSLTKSDQPAIQRVVNALYSTNLFERLSPADQQYLSKSQPQVVAQ